MKTIQITSIQKNYKIVIKNNLLNHLSDYLDVNKLYVIISDDKIPFEYIERVQKACPNNLIITFPEGEKSKSFEQYERIISILQDNNVTRDACIIALGGGVTGDLSGFIASTYLRGLDLIQIPTSLLAQIDSSVGGKVAINTEKAKNSVGSFYPPSLVLIDPLTLKTLSLRHFNNGMAEMIKYGMIYSKDLFDKILNDEVKENLEYFIYESLIIKKFFVENDEFDKGLRQILNFGHTYGHAYEAYYNFKRYFHGESIALGMLDVCDNEIVKEELLKILHKYNLPTKDSVDKDSLVPYIKNDKKQTKEYLNLIVVDEIGKAKIKKVRL
ncbi:MAG: 3-dehydroquinate synthase [Tenericutes bacterium]|nr:3-dehydroquinate synthase [Mycoplasmatota bacterium]